MHEASSLRAGSVARIAIRGFLALIAILAYGYCAAEVRMTHVGNVDKLVPRVEFLEDPAGVLTFGDVILAKHSEHFKTVPEESQPNFGLSRSVIWLRMSFALEKGAPPDRLLEVAYPFLGSVELFSDGLHVASGAARPFSTRPVAHRNFIFPLTLEEGATQTYYLRVSSEGTLTIPIQLWQPDAFHRGAQDSYLLLGMYYGEFVALLLYNLILFITLRDRAYLAYIAFITVIAATNLSYNGLGMQYVWPDWPTQGRVGLTITLALSAIFSMQFSRIFLNTPVNAPRMDIALKLVSGVFVLALGVATFDLRTAFLIMAISGLIFPALCLGAGLLSWARGHSTARFFLLGWSALLVGTSVYTMRTLNLVPATFFTLNAIQIGTAGELLLFSFALADRTRRLIDNNAELRERQRQLQDAALHDPLTGLGNRLLLDDRLGHALEVSRRNGNPVAVVIIDLDNFKPVNDQYGHAAGDALLKAIALLLSNAVRASDTVIRMGGDEFVLIIESLGVQEDAHRVVEKIRRELCRTMTVAGHPLQVGASIGVALCPIDAERQDDLLRIADTAMYRDKELRRSMSAVPA